MATNSGRMFNEVERRLCQEIKNSNLVLEVAIQRARAAGDAALADALKMQLDNNLDLLSEIGWR